MDEEHYSNDLFCNKCWRLIDPSEEYYKVQTTKDNIFLICEYCIYDVFNEYYCKHKTEFGSFNKIEIERV